MSETPNARFHGVHAALICPMRADYAIDEDALAAHVAHIAAVDGVEGFLINGHAGENAFLARSELKRVVEIARAAAPSAHLTCGALSESSLEAARQAADAEAAGADAILVFPPFSWALAEDPPVIRAHHEIVAAAISAPIALYKAPIAAGALSYSVDMMKRLLELPSVAAVKEGSWEVAAFEETLRLFRAERPEVAVLGSGDEHLLTSWLIGGDGSQVSLAAVAPEAVVALWRAAQKGDWSEARRWHERLYPLVAAIYRDPPASRANARLKAALGAQGVARTVRPPQRPASDAEAAHIAHMLAAALAPRRS